MPANRVNRLAIQLSLIAAGLLIVLAAVVAVRHRSGTTTDISKKNEPVRVFATVYVLGDLARAIGGRYVDVNAALQTGDSLPDFAFTDATRQQFRSADLCIVGGLTEPWALREVDAPFASDRLLRLDQLPSDQALATTNPASTAPGHFVWLDPQVARRACIAIAQHLAIARPEHNVYFSSLSNRVAAQIDATMAAHLQRLSALPASRRRAMALSHEFDDLAAAAGVEVIHPFNIEAGTLDDAQIRQIRAAAKEGDLHVLLMPANSIAVQATELSRATGMHAILLDPFGSSSIAGRTSYSDLLDSNLTQLEQALTAP